MIRPGILIRGKIIESINIKGKTNLSIIRPKLEPLEVMPKTEEQNLLPQLDGFSSVLVKGDANLKPENIKQGVSIFGLQGGLVDTADGTATSEDVVEGKTAYVDNQKVTGTMPNNGALEYDPSDEEQKIPSGLTSGGAVKPADITKLAEYEACLTLANSIENLDDYTETTATPEDLVEGKTAYSNGERIVGVMKVNNNNALIGTVIPNGEAKGSNIFKIIEKLPENITYSGYNASYMFNQCIALKEIPLIDLSTNTYMTGMCNQCAALESIPQFDTSKMQNMSIAFQGCTLLKDVPELNTSSVTDMRSMFANCPNLSDESLNNILAMCAKATLCTIGKTLKSMGLTSKQVTKCQSLSNYEAFVAAGWTTGY